MRKKLLSLLLTAIMVLQLFPAIPFTADTTANTLSIGVNKNGETGKWNSSADQTGTAYDTVNVSFNVKGTNITKLHGIFLAFNQEEFALVEYTGNGFRADDIFAAGNNYTSVGDSGGFFYLIPPFPNNYVPTDRWIAGGAGSVLYKQVVTEASSYGYINIIVNQEKVVNYGSDQAVVAFRLAHIDNDGDGKYAPDDIRLINHTTDGLVTTEPIALLNVDGETDPYQYNPDRTDIENVLAKPLFTGDAGITGEPAAAPTSITAVEAAITGFAGGSSAAGAVVEVNADAFYTVSATTWYEGESASGTAFTGNFAYDTTYTASFTFAPKDNYVFTDATTVKIGDTTLTLPVGAVTKDSITVAYSMTTSSEPLTEIEFVDVSIFVPDTDATISGAKAAIDDMANCTASTVWTKEVDGEYVSVGDDAVFAADTVYKATITLTPKASYTFVNTTVVNLDGNSTTPELVDNNLIITKIFAKTAAYITPEDYAKISFVAPSIGASPSDVTVVGSGTGITAAVTCYDATYTEGGGYVKSTTQPTAFEAGKHYCVELVIGTTQPHSYVFENDLSKYILSSDVKGIKGISEFYENLRITTPFFYTMPSYVAPEAVAKINVPAPVAGALVTDTEGASYSSPESEILGVSAQRWFLINPENAHPSDEFTDDTFAANTAYVAVLTVTLTDDGYIFNEDVSYDSPMYDYFEGHGEATGATVTYKDAKTLEVWAFFRTGSFFIPDTETDAALKAQFEISPLPLTFEHTDLVKDSVTVSKKADANENYTFSFEYQVQTDKTGAFTTLNVDETLEYDIRNNYKFVVTLTANENYAFADDSTEKTLEYPITVTEKELGALEVGYIVEEGYTVEHTDTITDDAFLLLLRGGSDFGISSQVGVFTYADGTYTAVTPDETYDYVNKKDSYYIKIQVTADTGYVFGEDSQVITEDGNTYFYKQITVNKKTVILPANASLASTAVHGDKIIDAEAEPVTGTTITLSARQSFTPSSSPVKSYDDPIGPDEIFEYGYTYDLRFEYAAESGYTLGPDYPDESVELETDIIHVVRADIVNENDEYFDENDIKAMLTVSPLEFVHDTAISANDISVDFIEGANEHISRSVKSVSYSTDGENYEPVSESELYDFSKKYRFSIVIQAEDGYRFGLDSDDNDITSMTFNYDITVTELEVTPSFNSTLTVMHGDTISPSAFVVTPAAGQDGYFVFLGYAYKVQIVKNGSPSVASGTYEYGKTYELLVVFNPNTGYTVNKEGTNITYDEALGGYCISIPITVNSIVIDLSSYVPTVSALVHDGKIADISVTNTPDNTDAVITRWSRKPTGTEGWGPIVDWSEDATETIVYGYDYKFSIKIYAKSGYSIKTANVNNAVIVNFATEPLTVEKAVLPSGYDFFGCLTLTSESVINDDPIAEKPVVSIKSDVTDAHFTVSEQSIVKDAPLWIDLDATDTNFVYGTIYAVKATLTAENGYLFSEPNEETTETRIVYLEFTVEEKEVTPSFNSTLTVMHGDTINPHTFLVTPAAGQENYFEFLEDEFSVQIVEGGSKTTVTEGTYEYGKTYELLVVFNPNTGYTVNTEGTNITYDDDLGGYCISIPITVSKEVLDLSSYVPTVSTLVHDGKIADISVTNTPDNTDAVITFWSRKPTGTENWEPAEDWSEDATETIVYGYDYNFLIRIYAKSGYSIKTANVNNATAVNFVTETLTVEKAVLPSDYDFFGCLTLTPESVINDDPIVEKPVVSIKSDVTDAHFTVSEQSIVKSNAPLWIDLDATDTNFVYGTIYAVKATLTAENGYLFSEPNEETTETRIVYLEFSVEEKEVTPDFTINGASASSAENTSKVEDNTFTIVDKDASEGWFTRVASEDYIMEDNNGVYTKLAGTDTFKYGADYTYYAAYTVNEGYKLPASYTATDGNYFFTFDIEVTKKTIALPDPYTPFADTVEFVHDANISGITNSMVTVPENFDSATIIKWYAGTDEITDSGAKFIYETAYFCDITLTPADGYTTGNNPDVITIEKAEVPAISKAIISYISVEGVPLPTVTEVPTVDSLSIPVGPSYGDAHYEINKGESMWCLAKDSTTAMTDTYFKAGQTYWLKIKYVLDYGYVLASDGTGIMSSNINVYLGTLLAETGSEVHYDGEEGYVLVYIPFKPLEKLSLPSINLPSFPEPKDYREDWLSEIEDYLDAFYDDETYANFIKQADFTNTALPYSESNVAVSNSTRLEPATVYEIQSEFFLDNDYYVLTADTSVTINGDSSTDDAFTVKPALNDDGKLTFTYAFDKTPETTITDVTASKKYTSYLGEEIELAFTVNDFDWLADVDDDRVWYIKNGTNSTAITTDMIVSDDTVKEIKEGENAVKFNVPANSDINNYLTNSITIGESGGTVSDAITVYTVHKPEITAVNASPSTAIPSAGGEVTITVSGTNLRNYSDFELVVIPVNSPYGEDATLLKDKQIIAQFAPDKPESPHDGTLPPVTSIISYSATFTVPSNHDTSVNSYNLYIIVNNEEPFGAKNQNLYLGEADISSTGNGETVRVSKTVPAVAYYGYSLELQLDFDDEELFIDTLTVNGFDIDESDFTVTDKLLTVRLTEDIATSIDESPEKTADFTITMTSYYVDVESILFESPGTIYVGDVFELSDYLTVMPLDASEKQLTYSVSMSNSRYASVDRDGTVRALKAGYVRIKATAVNGIYRYVTFRIYEKTINVTGIKLDYSKIYLTSYRTKTLSASVIPANAAETRVTWSSSNSYIARVDAYGNVTAVRPGTAVITAASVDGNFKAYCTVVVRAPGHYVTTPDDETSEPEEEVETQKVTLEVSPQMAYLRKGSALTLKYTITPAGADADGLVWSSADTSVVVVSSEGKVTAVGAGRAAVTVKTKDGSSYALCVFVITDPTSTASLMSSKTIITPFFK